MVLEQASEGRLPSLSLGWPVFHPVRPLSSLCLQPSCGFRITWSKSQRLRDSPQPLEQVFPATALMTFRAVILCCGAVLCPAGWRQQQLWDLPDGCQQHPTPSYDKQNSPDTVSGGQNLPWQGQGDKNHCPTRSVLSPHPTSVLDILLKIAHLHFPAQPQLNLAHRSYQHLTLL